MTNGTLDAACTKLGADASLWPVVLRSPLVRALDQTSTRAHWYLENRLRNFQKLKGDLVNVIPALDWIITFGASTFGGFLQSWQVFAFVFSSNVIKFTNTFLGMCRYYHIGWRRSSYYRLSSICRPNLTSFLFQDQLCYPVERSGILCTPSEDTLESSLAVALVVFSKCTLLLNKIWGNLLCSKLAA